MFNISHNLNKKAQITIVFTDKNFKFLNQSNFFSNKELGQVSLFKNDFGKSDFLKIDLLEDNKKQKIILYKIKEQSSEYDYQKIGGTVYSELSKFESANILLESEHSIKKNNFLFYSNFLLGFFSKSTK
jgi:leucyl aminopeptidase